MVKPEIQVSMREIEPTNPEKVHDASLKVGGCTNARIISLGCGACTAHEVSVDKHFLVSTCAGQTNPTGEVASPCTTYLAFRDHAVAKALQGQLTKHSTY